MFARVLRAVAFACSGTLAITFILLCGPAQASTPVEPKSITLPNGLRVFVAEQHSTPLVETTLWYRFGSSDETAGKTGLAHALEHMMFRGTPTLSAAGLSGYVAHFGGQFNASTDEDFTRFYFILPAAQLETTLRIEADRMQHLSLDPAQWNIERGAVLNEIDKNLNNPLARFLFSVREAAAESPGYRLPAMGDREDVAHATVADLRAYYERWYAPNNAVLTIVGDVDTNDAFAAARRAFGDIPSRPVPSETAAVTPPKGPATVSGKGEFPFEVVVLAFHMPGSSSKESADLYDLQNLEFGIDDQRGPFYKAVVQSGLAVGGFAMSEIHRFSSTLNVLYIVAPGHTASEVRTAFEGAARSVATTGLPATIVSGNSARIVAEDTFAHDSLDGLTNLVGDLATVTGISVAEDIARTSAVTPQSVQRVTRKYLATPTVVGDFAPTTSTFNGINTAGLSGQAADSFGARAEDGPPVIPEFVRLAMQSPVSFHSKIEPERFTVDGIQVLVQPIRGNGTVFIRGSLRQSPAFDPPGKEGLGDTVLALYRYGSTSTSFDSMQQILGSLGADLGIGRSIQARCFSRDLPTVAQLLASTLEHPAFPATYVSLTLRQQSQSISRIDQLPEYRFDRAYQELLLPRGDPELRQPTVASLARITATDIATYAKRYVRPEFLTLAIAGDVDPQRVRAILQHAFAGWKGTGAVPPVDLPSIPFAKAQRRAVTTTGDDITVRIGGAAVGRSSPDYDALQLASALLGGASDSRLMTELRQKRGLVYTASSTVLSDASRGTIQFDFATGAGTLTEARAIFLSQLGQFRAQPPSVRNEVESVKRMMVARAFASQDATSSIAEDLLSLGENGLPTTYYQTLAQRYELIAPEAVRAAAFKYMDPAHLVEVDQGPLGGS